MRIKMSFYPLYSQNKGKRLQPGDENALETKAVLAKDLTLRFFGRAIQLYTPMYLANYCDNSCLYCGFNKNNKIERRKLSFDEVEAEARFISSTGLKHILILTGEDRLESPLEYIKDCIKILKTYFSSISVEIYPLSEAEYTSFVKEGVDGLTIYQEVYDEEIYSRMHPTGPKKDYLFRLDAPERGARAGMRSINIGVLLGLNDWRVEAFMLGLHAQYLQDKFPDVEIGVSLPRIRPQVSGFKPAYVVSDRDLAQIIIYLRLKLPRLSISLSTREGAGLRENLIPLGITRISAGSSTLVGGHTLEGSQESAQFKIQDQRSVEEIKTMLYKKGYQPVLKDWMPI
ncbi:MAG: 2-iminoacetate synthase ThiH [Candidatus Omnitrophica bacterium]|nr:2-iminoacetate synthase ThiH [Candidatus Omnitrophota bacterium]